MGKISKDKRDIYYRLAKQLSYRSRSAFKLKQINDYFNIFAESKYVVDLCAAPGGWSQIATEILSKNYREYKLIAIDIQEMAPLEGVDIILGDITSQSTLINILSKTDDKLVDLVMCDGAPDVTGFNEFDVFIQSQLILSALNISLRLLKEGGSFISKIFKGKHTIKVLSTLLNFFKKVTIAKPRACRNASFESFIVCQGFFIDHNSDIIMNLRNGSLKEEDLILLNTLVKNIDEDDYENLGVELVQVGTDEYDSDKSYDLSCTNYTMLLQPIQSPINPPYKFYIDYLKGKNN